MTEQQIRQRLRDQGQSDEEIENLIDQVADNRRRNEQDREVENQVKWDRLGGLYMPYG